MAEPVSRYTADIDLEGVNDAHVLALGRVPGNCRVLDLGAADGSMAEVLVGMGCQVWGVEWDPAAAEQARRHCVEVAVADLNTADLAECFAGQKFDVVLMLDVLEHLVDPATVLRGVAGVLADGGWGIISLPNVAHVSLRLALLDGRFEYRDAGLLDRTHLRFFDREGVDGLIEAAGWSMFDLARVTRRFGTTEIQMDADPELVRRLESDPEGLTYQFIVSAAPAGSAVLDRPPVLPAAAAQARVMQLEAQLAERQRDIEWLLERTVTDLPDQLEAIRQASLDRRSQLAALLAALQEDTDRLRQSLQG